MKIEFDLNIADLEKPIIKDGQITTKIAKSREEKFKIYNIKYDKRLSEYMRAFANFLIDKFEEIDTRAS